ncbi:MAG: M28 family metallopeptidase [Vicinamibacterales bacterium]
MPLKRLPVAVLLSLLVAGCTPSAAPPDQAAGPVSIIPASAIEAHMRFLASDLLEGREAGTRGYDLAASYVSSQFRQLNLNPAGDSGTYFQQVPLQAHWLMKPGARMTVRHGARSMSLALGTQFTIDSSPIRATSTVDAPAVFVGYGIEAPAFEVNDYDGLDVRGKIVVALTGYPAFMPSEEGAHFGSSREKQRTAAAKGAVGFVSIFTERFEKVRPWARYTESLDHMQMTWIGPDGQAFVAAPDLQAAGVVSPADGALLFEGAPRSYAEVRAEAVKAAPKGFPLAVSLQMTQQSRQERRSSANVVAILPGSDSQLRNEFVVVLGHLDHEGLGGEDEKDRIYNGALDNAAGIASLLESARALAAAGQPPRRSIVFLAVTAEEKGLLGSEYFARHPTVPLQAITAAVNIDMPVLLYDFTDVVAFGANHSSMQAAVASAAKQVGLTLTPDPMPDQALFTRSDHYRFVQQGVPSIFLSTGWNTKAGPGEGGKVFESFLASHYHKPSDDLNLPVNYEAGARFATVNYLIARELADADAPARWNDGDFFGDLFAKGR